MSGLGKMQEWISTFPGEIPPDFQIDYTSEIPQTAGLFPTGVMELSRSEDILGNVTVTNQHNYSLYVMFDKPADVAEISEKNAEWILSFQRWVQEQSITKQAPVFGNTETDRETIRAQNGQFFGDKDRGVGVYIVMITITFKIHYEVN